MGKKAEKKKLEKKAKQQKKIEKKAKKAKREAATGISSVQRQEMVATAAYYIAERHGFTPGRSDADWQAAEMEIEKLLQGGKRRKKEETA